MVDYALVAEWQRINRDLMATCDEQAKTVTRVIDGLERSIGIIDEERKRHDRTNKRVTQLEHRVRDLTLALLLVGVTLFLMLWLR